MSCRNFLKPQLRNQEYLPSLLQCENKSPISFYFCIGIYSVVLQHYSGTGNYTFLSSMYQSTKKTGSGLVVGGLSGGDGWGNGGDLDTPCRQDQHQVRPLWGTATRCEDKDLHPSLMNPWCGKWKQSLARSKAAPDLEMGANRKQKQPRVCNYWGTAQMKVIIPGPPKCMCRRRIFHIYNAAWTWLWGRRETKIDHLLKYSVTFWGYL